MKYYLHINTSQNTIFGVKNHRFKMKWLEKYMYYLSERRRRELHFLDILFGDTVDMY